MKLLPQRMLLTAASLAILAGIGLFDVITGTISFSLFYLIPIAIAAWYGGEIIGLVISVFSAGVWSLVYVLEFGNRGWKIVTWEVGVILALFAIVSLLLSRLKQTQDDLHETIRSLEREVARREAMEETLREYQEHLEELVEERTAKLRAANWELETFSSLALKDFLPSAESFEELNHLLLEDPDSQLDESARAHLISTLADFRKSLRIIDDTLRLTRVGRVPMKHEPVNLSEIARDIAQKLKHVQPDRHVEFSIQDGVTAKGDAESLQWMMENLLGNAWKFTSQREASRIEFGATEAPRSYYVRDNGVGFAPENAEAIFRPFQKTYGADELRDTGLGLALAKRIVERHGGTMWAEGAPGQGATFHFALAE